MSQPESPAGCGSLAVMQAGAQPQHLVPAGCGNPAVVQVGALTGTVPQALSSTAAQSESNSVLKKPGVEQALECEFPMIYNVSVRECSLLVCSCP